MVIRPSADGSNILVANRAFDTNEVVFTEVVLIEFTTLDELMIKYKESSAKTQTKVNDMCHRPLEQITAMEIRKDAENLSLKHCMPFDLVLKLLDIRHTSAYSFRSQSANADSSKNITNNRIGLFHIASKANHSCDPNVSFSSSSQNFMKFTALKRIEVGEEICSSYVADLYSTPRRARRQRLLETKNFFCKCPRCTGIDDCRGLICKEADCSGSLHCIDDDISNWICHECSVTNEKDLGKELALETELIRRYKGIEQLMRSSQLDNPTILTEIVRDASSILSSHHFLIVDCFRLLFAFFMGQIDSMLESGLRPSAHFMSPWKEIVSINSFRISAGDACFRTVQIRECIAAKCFAQNCTSSSHPPIYDLSLDVLEASKALISSEQEAAVHKACIIYEKYYPFLVTALGEDSKDLVEYKKLKLKLSKSTLTGNSANIPSERRVLINRCSNPQCIQPIEAKLVCSRCSGCYYCSKPCQVNVVWIIS